jgi:hypothetical protein
MTFRMNCFAVPINTRRPLALIIAIRTFVSLFLSTDILQVPIQVRLKLKLLGAFSTKEARVTFLQEEVTLIVHCFHLSNQLTGHKEIPLLHVRKCILNLRPIEAMKLTILIREWGWKSKIKINALKSTIYVRIHILLYCQLIVIGLFCYQQISSMKKKLRNVLFIIQNNNTI